MPDAMVEFTEKWVWKRASHHPAAAIICTVSGRFVHEACCWQFAKGVTDDHNRALMFDELVMMFEQLLAELEYPPSDPEWRAGLIRVGNALIARIEAMEKETP